MIGLAIKDSEHVETRELFELFKTPWEFCRPGVVYPVVISTGELSPEQRGTLNLIFSAERLPIDNEYKIALLHKAKGAMVSHQGRSFPIYGSAARFSDSSAPVLTDAHSAETLVYGRKTNGITNIRIGYNLCEEVRRLLMEGQPAAHAHFPTLEFHLELLRDLITRGGEPLAEIPPVPSGYKFAVCLTHDIDHPLLRNHCVDHTMFGFLARATVGSVADFCRGRLSRRELIRNGLAAFSLPLVYLGFAKDFWATFTEKYLEIEAGLGATYFFIPTRGKPGKKADGSVAPMRACRYELAQLIPQLSQITRSGNEVAVHGLDAWRDVQEGQREKAAIESAIAAPSLGVRMHWLYFGAKSHEILEQAGFTYDSTVGYNETVGYRAGTTQVYRPLGRHRLLELPLHIMDTALFYPSYLKLTQEEARRRVRAMVDEVKALGGVLTFNWHDRSLAPDRNWGDVYLEIVKEMKRESAWFPKAGEAVAWFNKRREAKFEIVENDNGETCLSVEHQPADNLPALKLRVYPACQRGEQEALAMGSSSTFSETTVDQLTGSYSILWT